MGTSAVKEKSIVNALAWHQQGQPAPARRMSKGHPMVTYKYAQHPINEAFLKVWALRDQALNQEEMGRRLGVHQTEISKWIKGERQPSYEHLPAIEAAMGLPRGTLLRMAGYVDERIDAVKAVRADSRLSMASKNVIVRLIESEIRQRRRKSP